MDPDFRDSGEQPPVLTMNTSFHAAPGSAEADLTHLSDEDLETLERILRPPGLPPVRLLTGRGAPPTEENS